MKLKILLLSDSTSIHTERWVRAITSLGHTVELISFRNKKVAGIQTHFMPSYGLGKFSYLFSIFKIKKILKTFKPDIVHAHHITSYGFIASLLKFKPTILTAWGSDILVTPKESFIYQVITKSALKNCTQITAVAEHMKESLIELKVPSEKIKIIPFGVDLEIFKPQSKVDTSQITILSTRNFTPVYSIETLIQAISIIKKETSITLNLKLAGKGPLLEYFHKMIQDLNISSQVKFIGHLTQVELAHELSQADFFVTTALSDGNNISLNEAMACGAYPIATNIPANAQWIENNVNGRLFEPGNSKDLAKVLIQCLNQRENLNKAIESNFKIVKEKANWNQNVSEMNALYYQLLEKK